MVRTPRNPKSDRELPVDDALLATVAAVAKKHNREDQLAGSPPTLELGLPVPSLAFRYLLQNSGLPLGLVYHIVGPPAVFKSTLLFELIRWHIVCNGVGIICETETKPTPALRKSILGWDNPPNVIVRECTSVEHWQETIIDYVKAIQKSYKDEGKQLDRPVAFGVDSYMGKMPRRLQEKFAKQGYAERHFGEAAQIIGDWLSVYTALVQGQPFTLIGVNHLKKSVDPITGNPIYRTPGGQFLQHQNVIEIRVSRSNTERRLVNDVPIYETILRLHTSKNSRGAQDKTIFVILRQWNEIDESGKPRLCSNFEWWDASIRMLYDGWGLSSAEREIVLPLVKKVLNVQRRSRGDLYWCEELGVSKDSAMSAHDLGLLLEDNEAILKELYKALGISILDIFESKGGLLKPTAVSSTELPEDAQENVPEDLDVPEVDV